MKTITSEFVAMGRFTRFPAKEAVVQSVKDGNHVDLSVGRDDEGQVILIDPNTQEAAGCIPPNPSYGDDYDLLESFIDLGLPMKAKAAKHTKTNHYRVQISVSY